MGLLTSYETFVSAKLYEHAKFFTAGSPGIWMFATPLLISKSVWDGLTEKEQEAFEAAAEISEDYFAATQKDAEKKFIEVFTRAGAKYHRFTNQDYLAWLRLAQQTARREYFALSPTTEYAARSGANHAGCHKFKVMKQTPSRWRWRARPAPWQGRRRTGAIAQTFCKPLWPLRGVGGAQDHAALLTRHGAAMANGERAGTQKRLIDGARGPIGSCL